jgi:hypothetical protein
VSGVGPAETQVSVAKKGIPKIFRDASYQYRQTLESEPLTRPEAFAVPASSVLLPASSPRASALLAAGVEAEAPAWSPPEAFAAAGDRLREELRAAERTGGGSARDERVRDDCSAVPRAGCHCAPVVQLADSSGGGPTRVDCLADSAGYLFPALSDDLSRGGYSASVDWAGRQADDLPRDGYLVDSSRDDCSAARTADDRSPLVAGLDDSSLGDCLAETTSVDSVARMAGDLVGLERRCPRPDVRLAPADWPVGSPLGCWALWGRVVPVAQHSTGSQVR